MTSYEWLVPSLTLLDPNDCHVLVAAIKGEADVIVTTNIDDFPESILNKYGIEAQHPDDFLSNLIDGLSISCPAYPA